MNRNVRNINKRQLEGKKEKENVRKERDERRKKGKKNSS